MRNNTNTGEQSVNELARLRRRVAELEKVDAECRKMKEKAGHINAVLHSLRTVNRIVTQEQDCDRLLQGICEALVTTRGYKNAWIALMDNSGKMSKAAQAGLGKEFSSLVKQLKEGSYPACVRRALRLSGAVIIEDPPSECPECLLSYGYVGRKGMSIRLKYGNEVYGVLTVSTPADIRVDDKEEQSLYKEIAQDVSFAIYNLRIAEDRRRVRQEIEMLSKFPSENPYPVLRIDHDGTIQYANRASSSLLKAWSCRLGRKLPGEWYRLTIDALNSGSRREAEITCGDRILLLTFAPVKEAGYLNVYGIDITERQKAKKAEELKKLAESLIDFQEEERKRVAREMHDQIGQLLAAVKLHLRMISRDHPDLEESINSGLKKAESLLDQAQEDARRISARLRPEILDDFGLSAAIENEIGTLTDLSDLNITFKVEDLPERIAPPKEVALYRVTQEALTNIIRHAGASSVTLTLTKKGGKVVLSILDDGKGFTRDDPRAMRMGILGMKERIDSVGGVLLIESNPGGGTILRAEIPLRPGKKSRE